MIGLHEKLIYKAKKLAKKALATLADLLSLHTQVISANQIKVIKF